MKDNSTLTFGCLELEDPLIDMFDNLNRAGRARVIDNKDATEKDWVEVLEASDGDLDCLFYFLREKPSLCTLINPLLVDQSGDS